MKIFDMISFADIFTLANLSLGFLSILLSLRGMFILSFIALILALFMDGLDGRVARFLKRKDNFGLQLDSLSDLISFGVATSVFGFLFGLNSLFSIIVFVIFLCCCALRLARFNINKQKTKGNYFEGIPTPTSVILPLILLIFGLNQWLILLYLIFGLLMTSSVKIKKI